MRVMIVTKSFSKGGSASGASNLADSLEAMGCEVLRLDAYDEQRKTLLGFLRFIERAAERLMCDAETHCLRLGPPVFNLPSLWHQYKPDVIQLCDISGNVIRFADFSEIPCPIVHRMSDFWPYHGPSHYAITENNGGRLKNWLFHSTVFDGRYLPNLCVAPSNWLADHLSSTNVKKPPVRVIRNAVKTPRLQVNNTLHSGVLQFGFVSNSILDPRKGFCALPSLLEGLSETGLRIILHLHGRISFKECPKIPGVEVVCHGPFRRSELEQVYSSFDVLICPSRLDNSPNVLCEAMAHGCPVIAQAGTGMDSYVTSETGFLLDFKGEGQNLLSDFVFACKRIREDYDCYSKASMNHAREELSLEVIGRAYIEIYNDLIEMSREKEAGPHDFVS